MCEKEHNVSFHTGHHLRLTELSSLLQHRIFSPVAKWNLVHLFVDVSEACSFDTGLEVVSGVEVLFGFPADGNKSRAPLCQKGVCRHGPVIAAIVDVDFDLLDPSAREEMLICLLVNPLPLPIGERAKHVSHMHEVEFLLIEPWFEHVVDLELAIRRHPRVRWGIEIDAQNDS